MEISALAAALSSIKNASDIAKLIKESGASLEKAEVKLKLAELVEALAEAKMETASIREVLLEKDDELRRLKSEIEIKDKIIWENPYYFLINGDVKDGPFCQRCYDSEKKLIRLQSPGRNGYWECKECNSGYKDSTYKEVVDVFPNKILGGTDFSDF